MAKKTDKAPIPGDKSEEENQESLLNALESIKDLLEQSENKLSAARASLHDANEKQESHPVETNKKKASNEPVVPVLDDIIFDEHTNESEFMDINKPGNESGHDENSLGDINLNDIPVLGDEPIEPATAGKNKAEMLAYLDKLQASLEKNIRNTLMRTVVTIETEVKKTIAKELDQLRHDINKK